MIVSYKHVDIAYGKHKVLQDCNFEANEGELIYLVGDEGSGKTSLMHSMYGEVTPTSGESMVLDTDIRKLKYSKLPYLRRQIGIVFQEHHLLPDRTVRQNLDFVLEATDWKDKDKRQQRVIEVLEYVNMPDKVNKLPHELSGGEKQRACIARALLNTPKLLIADEPMRNLSTENAAKIMEILTSLCQNGTTVIISTHNRKWQQMYPGKVYLFEENTIHTDNNEE